MLPLLKIKNNYIHLAEPFLGVYYLWFFLPFMRTTYGGIYKYFFFLFFLIGIFLLTMENVNAAGLQIKVKHTIVAPIVAYMAFMVFLCLFDIHDAGDHIRVSFTFWGTALIYYLMGIIEQQAGQYEAAVSYLNHALSLKDKSAYREALSFTLRMQQLKH